MSKWKPENRPNHVCPKCNESGNKGTRWPYCGIGGVNYISYKCKNCGYEWTATD